MIKKTISRFLLFLVCLVSFLGDVKAASVNFRNSDWMADLEEYIGDKPINEISMPGSHDSGTYPFSWKSKVSNDGSLPSFLDHLRPASALIITRWSKTQSLPISSQLNTCGVRYLDLRVAYYKKDKKLYLCHGLNGKTVEYELRQIRTFLDAHPKEILILDFNHFYYDSNEDLHEQLIQFLEDNFDGKMACRSEFGENIKAITLKSMLAKGRQVIILYMKKNLDKDQDKDFLWPQGKINSKWADKADIALLEDELSRYHLEIHPGNQLRVIQYILTPNANYIKKHFLSSLQKMNKVTISSFDNFWAKLQNTTTNIFLLDFCDINICKKIIAKNVQR